MKLYLAAGVSFALLVSAAVAQGVPGGIEQGSRRGEREAGPVGAVVGGVIGGVVGGINGVLGVDDRPRFWSYVAEQRRRHTLIAAKWGPALFCLKRA